MAAWAAVGIETFLSCVDTHFLAQAAVAAFPEVPCLQATIRSAAAEKGPTYYKMAPVKEPALAVVVATALSTASRTRGWPCVQRRKY